MFARILVCLFCILCLFFAALSTQSSNSGNNVSAWVENDDWKVLFNDWNEFYDRHHVIATVSAPFNYYGSYTAEAVVTGNGKRADDGAISDYYQGGVFDADHALLTFPDLPNVEVSGTGSGWCRIHGTPPDLSSLTEEAEDSNYYHL